MEYNVLSYINRLSDFISLCFVIHVGLTRHVKVYKEGDTMYFECNADDKAVIGRIRWQKYGKGVWRQVARNNQLQSSPTSIYLALTNTTVNDSGRYRCADRKKVVYAALMLKIGKICMSI